MKTTELFLHRALILAACVTALALPACSVIVVQETSEPSAADVLFTASPTPEASQPPPPPTATVPPTLDAPSPTASAQLSVETRTPSPTLTPAPTLTTAPAADVPSGSWQAIPHLPRYVNALVADPTDPRVFYAGTGFTGSGSGVYKSEDAGLNWYKASAGLPSEDVAALAFSDGEPSMLYAAVGNNLFASADGGASWSARAQRVGNGRGFEQLRVAPGNAQVLYGVAVIEGAFRSDDGGNNWLAVNEGLPRDNNGSLNAQSLGLDPSDANVVYLGTGWGPFHGNGVFKSTDGGGTWTPANRGIVDYSITTLAVDPINPQVVYAGSGGGELFKSVNGGQTWSDLTERLPVQCNSIYEIALDPGASGTVFLLCGREGGLVSNDGGVSWRLLGKPGELDYPSFTAMTIIFAPQPVLVIGSQGDGGWRYDVTQPAAIPTPTASPSAGVTDESALPLGSWRKIPHLPRYVNALVVDPANPQVLYAGSGFTGSGSGVHKSEDAGLGWREVSAGLPSEDVTALAFGRGEPPILYAAVGTSLFTSAEGGASWSQRAQRVGNGRGFERLYVAPGNGKTLYGLAVIEGAFRSADGGNNWLAVNEGLPRDDNGLLNAQSLAMDPSDANTVYLGTGWGPFHGNGVFKSTDGGGTWLPANQGMLDYSITALAVDPFNPTTVYAGGSEGELFKSADGGQTWNDLTERLPVQEYSRSTIRDIILDPVTPETIYLLCEREGSLVSQDGGASWHLLGKPAELDYPSFTAMAVALGERPILVAGIRDEGGWRYAPD